MKNTDNSQNENLAKLTISKISSTGSSIFGSNFSQKRYIDIDFKNAELIDSFGSSNIFSNRNISRVSLSNEQWTIFLLNKNNPNGVPCSIIQREDVEIDKTVRIKGEGGNIFQNNYQNTLLKFKKDLQKIFPTAYSIEKSSKSLLTKDNTSEDRKKLLSLKNQALKEWNENKNKLLKLLDKTFNTFEEEAQKDLADEIKNNFLGHGEAIESLKYKMNPLTSPNKNSSKNTIVNYHGVLTLKEIESEVGFVEDFDVKNGYKITLHEAIENGDTITPGDVIVSVEMSVAQFSEFISSFNQGDGITATLVETKLKGPIKKDFKNLDILTRKTEEFNNYISTEIEEILNEHSEGLESILKKKIGVKKLRDIEITYQQFYNKIYSNILFHVEDLLKTRLKSNLSKKMDFEFFVDKTVRDLGLKSLIEDSIDNDFSKIKNMLSEYSSKNKEPKKIDNKSNKRPSS